MTAPGFTHFNSEVVKWEGKKNKKAGTDFHQVYHIMPLLPRSFRHTKRPAGGQTETKTDKEFVLNVQSAMETERWTERQTETDRQHGTEASFYEQTRKNIIFWHKSYTSQIDNNDYHTVPQMSRLSCHIGIIQFMYCHLLRVTQACTKARSLLSRCCGYQKQNKKVQERLSAYISREYKWETDIIGFKILPQQCTI